MSTIVFGNSINCIMLAKKKCRDSEDPKHCEVIEYYRCFR
jgi:hypothetical protein